MMNKTRERITPGKMGKNDVKRKIVIVLVIMATFLINACQTLPMKSPERALQNRVNGMMAARVAQNWAQVYEYLNPDYKNKVSKENFTSIKREISYGDYTINTISISPSGKEALVVLKYDMAVMGFDVTDHSENQNWIQADRKWYYQMKSDSITGMD